MMRRLPSAAALLLLACSAGAQQPAPAPASTCQPGVDALDYDIRLELPDTGAHLRGDVTLTAHRAPAVRSVRLDLVRTLTVRDVAVNDVPVRADRTGDVIIVPLAGTAGDTVRIRVRYDGTVTDGLVVRRDARGRWSGFGDNWPDRARQWLAVIDHPSDKATVTFTVQAPSSRTVVSNGVLLGVRPLGAAAAGRTETRWRSAQPIPTYLMVVGAGSLVATDIPDPECRASATHRCVPQTVYTMPEQRSFAPGPFAAAPRIVRFFESLVGPFPYDKLAHVQSLTRFGGMENAGAIFYADRLFVERTLGDALIAHETAHQWFGDAVTEREWADLWLSEGFATYYAALWAREAHGEDAFRRELATMRQQILADSVVARRPVIDSLQRDYLALLNTNSYQKGGYVLAMLHEQMGDSAFHAGVRRYYERFRHGNASTEELRRAMEGASSRSYGSFFDQWLRRPGVPEVQVGWAWSAESRSVLVAAMQRGAAPPYALRIPVVVTDAAGNVTRATVEAPAVPHAIMRVPGDYPVRPRSVVIDPDSWMLARLTRL
jgi:aminopeptidase N